MKLLTKCIQYGNSKPDTLNVADRPATFLIPKETMEPLNLTLLQICRNSNSSKLSCKNEEDQIKMKVLDCSQDFSHYKSIGIFPDAQQLTIYSAVHSPIWTNFELVQDFMVVLLTCKNEEDPIKIEALECSQNNT